MWSSLETLMTSGVLLIVTQVHDPPDFQAARQEIYGDNLEMVCLFQATEIECLIDNLQISRSSNCIVIQV